MECDATYQRKLRQKRLQQQFREQMEKKQKVPGVTPSSKQGEKWHSKLALPTRAAGRHRLPTVQEPGQLHVLLCCAINTPLGPQAAALSTFPPLFPKCQEGQL